ncbi:MAG TPA: TonB-dependent receptor [Longimicrobiaceae bacterium]|nr:TonB-dependent receptor [Longimicrobiaceae bacterium]
MKRIAAAIVALSVAVPAAAWAQTAPPAGARPMGGAPGAMQQQAGGEIRGAVRDAASGQPLPAASIAVWSAADSTLVAGAVTRPDGTFRIEGMRPGAYYLKVSHLGYATGTVARVALAPGGAPADVGEVRLAAGAVMLAGIEATAERSEVATAVDRTVYSARDLPAASGGNATDVLRNVPAIEVDGDGRVSLRGNQNVAIQLNGRPAPLRGDALTNFLKQLPANMVDRVEVVPNPSAKYDPDGMGGIINIVMKQDASLGLSGGLTLGAGTGGKYNGNGNLGWQEGPLTLFGSYGLFADSRQSSGFNHRESLQNGSVLSYLNQDIAGEFANTSHNFNGSADLRLGARNTLSGSAMLSLRSADMENANGFAELDGGQNLVRRFDELTDRGMDNWTVDGSLAFKRVLTPQRHEISAEVRMNRSSDASLSRFTTFPFIGADRADDPSQVRTEDSDNGNRQLTFQVDYTRPLSGALKLETGFKGTLRSIGNDFAEEIVLGTGGGDLDNSFEYDESVYAAYGLLTRSFGRLGLQGGLRVERASNTFDLTTTGEAFDNDYTSLFPSAAATLELGGERQVRASYSKRIQRPDTRLLNPFPMSEDPYNRFQGNPHLNPEYTHSMEVAFQQSLPWGSLQVSPFYRYTTDAVRRLRTVEGDVTVTSFENLATSKSYGADLTGSLRLGRLNGFTSFSAYRMVTDGSNLDASIGSDALTWSARASLTFKVTPTTDLSWFTFYRAPMDIEGGRISAMGMSNLAIRQKLMGDRASLSLRLSDPFDQMEFSQRSLDAVHLQDSRRKFGARAAFLTFSYNFGRAPRIRQPQAQPDQQPQAQPGMDMPAGS